MANSLAYSQRPDDALIARWVDALNVNDAPARRNGISEAITFFHQHMPTLPTSEAVSFLRCMDLSKLVTTIRLRPGEILVAYRSLNQNPLRLFYTQKGYAPQHLGLNLSGKVRKVFRVTTSMPALQSYATAAIDSWSRVEPGQDVVINPRSNELNTEFGVVTSGGGLQLMCPYAHMNLSCLNP